MEEHNVDAGDMPASEEDESSVEIDSGEYDICSPPTLTPQLSEESKWVLMQLERIKNPFAKWLKITFDRSGDYCQACEYRSPLEGGIEESFFYAYELMVCNFYQLLEVYRQLSCFFEERNLRKLLVIDLEIKSSEIAIIELQHMLFNAMKLDEFRLLELCNVSAQRYEQYYSHKEKHACSKFLGSYGGGVVCDYNIHIEFSKPLILFDRGVTERYI